MVTRLPHRLDAEVLSTKYETLQEWADAHAQMLSELILEGGEYLANAEEDVITVLEIWADNEPAFVIEMNSNNAGRTMKINEDHWVQVEDYFRAARARDAGEYIKKRTMDGNTTN